MSDAQQIPNYLHSSILSLLLIPKKIKKASSSYVKMKIARGKEIT